MCRTYEGKSVWMKNGYTMPLLSVCGRQGGVRKDVQGVIPPLQRLDVKKAIKATVPSECGRRHRVTGRGRRWWCSRSPDGKDQYATPVGAMEGSEEQYYCDLLFFYDDPHTIYTHWPKDMWAAVDAHQVKQGMNELQTRMAIGQKMHPDGQKEGDRTVTYDQDGKNWTVTFVKDRATVVKKG